MHKERYPQPKPQDRLNTKTVACRNCGQYMKSGIKYQHINGQLEPYCPHYYCSRCGYTEDI